MDKVSLWLGERDSQAILRLPSSADDKLLPELSLGKDLTCSRTAVRRKAHTLTAHRAERYTG